MMFLHRILLFPDIECKNLTINDSIFHGPAETYTASSETFALPTVFITTSQIPLQILGNHKNKEWAVTDFHK